MNFKLEITGLKEFQAGLSDLAKTQIPFAISKALNDTVYGGRLAMQKEMDDSFDRPTPIVRNSVLYEKSSPENLSASVYIKSDDTKGINVARILAPHVFGIGRSVKASESRLRRYGLLGPNQYITPGPAAPLDQYGNISSSNMEKILQQIFAFSGDASYNSYRKGMKQKRGAIRGLYCVPYSGVFQRAQGAGWGALGTPVLFFTNKVPQYEKRFDFFYAFASEVENNFMKNLVQAWGSISLKAGYRGN